MKQFISIIFITTLLLSNLEAFAQLQSATPRKWGIETELIQPFLPNVGIFRIKALKTITAEGSKMPGDLIVGAYIRPNVKHDIVEKIDEYLFILGYRQYLWKGLHVEATSNIGYAAGTKNKIDGKDYNNFSWFWEANVGYKINFAHKDNFNLYVIPQFGVISSISADIGPRGGKSDTFPQGNLVVGINF
jgi:hypothetical protein